MYHADNANKYGSIHNWKKMCNKRSMNKGKYAIQTEHIGNPYNDTKVSIRNDTDYKNN